MVRDPLYGVFRSEMATFPKAFIHSMRSIGESGLGAVVSCTTVEWLVWA